MGDIEIRKLAVLGDAEIAGLCDVMIDCVVGGASVNFLNPMTQAKAAAFWRRQVDGVAGGERVVLVAEDQGAIVGTVSLVPAPQENQPHRADVAKMLVHRRARKRGIGAALLQAIEREALMLKKTVLVLDTASDDADRLYTRAGWVRLGTIPNYALWPDGAPCPATFFYKQLG